MKELKRLTSVKTENKRKIMMSCAAVLCGITFKKKGDIYD